MDSERDCTNPIMGTLNILFTSYRRRHAHFLSCYSSAFHQWKWRYPESPSKLMPTILIIFLKKKCHSHILCGVQVMI